MTEKEKELLEPDSINKEIATQPENNELIHGEELVFAFDDVTSMIKKDLEQTDEILGNFVNMVMNEGDGSTASKEAICKLLEIKLKGADSITRMLDLKTRILLKEKNTFPAYMAQHNTYNINPEEKINKRELITALEKKKKEARANDKKD